MKGTLFGSLLTIACLRLVYMQFEGVVVARLPFEPIKMVSGLSHYGLQGNDMTDCSMMFVYMLMSLTIANYAKKIVSLEGPRVMMPQASPWG